jgi:hypothetical protein
VFSINRVFQKSPSTRDFVEKNLSDWTNNKLPNHFIFVVF